GIWRRSGRSSPPCRRTAPPRSSCARRAPRSSRRRTTSRRSGPRSRSCTPAGRPGRWTARRSPRAGASGSPARVASRSSRRCCVKRWPELLFLATLFCVTFEKLQWKVAGTVSLADVLTVAFLVVFALSYRDRLPRSAGILLLFFAAFLLVYLVGFYNLDTKQALDQFTKGIVKWVLHFLFLGAGVVLVTRKGQPFYWRAVAALV